MNSLKLNRLFLISFIFSTILIKNNSCLKVARCYISSFNNSNVSGEISFFQENENSTVNVTIKVQGISGVQAFHIHEYAPKYNNCSMSGQDYNPFNKSHGGPQDRERHVGDLGNIKGNDSIVYMNFTDNVISLFGNYSIISKGCVIHLYEDKLGKSQSQDGGSGPIVGCGEIREENLNILLILGMIFLFSISIFSISFCYCASNTPNNEEVLESQKTENSNLQLTENFNKSL